MQSDTTFHRKNDHDYQNTVSTIVDDQGQRYEIGRCGTSRAFEPPSRIMSTSSISPCINGAAKHGRITVTVCGPDCHGKRTTEEPWLRWAVLRQLLDDHDQHERFTMPTAIHQITLEPR
jgi:hypothetical protein